MSASPKRPAGPPCPTSGSTGIFTEAAVIQPELINDVIQPFFASAFLLKFFPVSQAPQLFDLSWRIWRTRDSQFDGARHYHLISIQEAPAKPTPER
jgi:hypothetical protein